MLLRRTKGLFRTNEAYIFSYSNLHPPIAGMIGVNSSEISTTALMILHTRRSYGGLTEYPMLNKDSSHISPMTSNSPENSVVTLTP